MRIWICLGVTALFAGMASAQAQPDAGEILTKVKDTWKDLKSYDVQFAMTLHDPKSGKEESGRIRVAAGIEPDRYRLEVHGGDALRPDDADASVPSLDGTIAIYDGSTFWLYVPAQNAYRTLTAKPDELGRDMKPSKVNIDDGIGQYIRLVERFDNSHFLREETASDSSGASTACLVIGKEPGQVMWIDKSTYHVLRVEGVELDGPGETIIIGIKLNEPLSDDLFKFVPPPGAKDLGLQ